MARQPTARQFSRAYNDCTAAYRNRLKRAGLKPGEHIAGEQPRLDISTIPGIVACWDASYAPATTSQSGGFLPTLGDRSGSGNLLTSAGTGNDRPVFLQGTRSVFRTDGGSGFRRFDAPVDVADGLFAGGGMVVALVESASSATTLGVLLGKWNASGWIMYKAASNQVGLQAYAAGNGIPVGYTFNVPQNSLFLVEVEWDSDTPNTPPVVRINGAAVQVAAADSLPSPVVDATATLCVGNRNWGSLNTPWLGRIGEVALFSAVPTAQQRSAVRSDFMKHWAIAA